MICLFSLLLFSIICCLPAKVVLAEDDNIIANPFENLALSINPTSDQSRAEASLQASATSTNSGDFLVSRSNYPETNPHVCLAFLSCCQRTDLLNHTIAGAIRHMEEDEPDYLRYEIAWVDNGNSQSSTVKIKESYPIEHALTLSKNMGLAYGMNLLLQNLCTAPYILFLEEDWLYLDDVVADQTEERKRSIATSIALLENLEKNEVTAYDGRNIIGTFLRHETYDSFLRFPHADVWERREDVDFRQTLDSLSSSNTCSEDTTELTSKSESVGNIDYQIFCADTGLGSGNIFGSFTNGSGLYRRSDLVKIGRQFGEPGDAFHDRYVESNFAYRVGLGNCHAAVRLTKDQSCSSILDPKCTGAFHHIGGGRGTRPQTTEGTKCIDFAWNFFGTPLYDKFQKHVAQVTGKPSLTCTAKELEELREQKFRDTDAETYREEVKKENEKVFQNEAQKRQQMRNDAKIFLETLREGEGDAVRRMVSWMRDMSDEEIENTATHMEKLADSPHPLDGFWDTHGRVRQ